MNVSSIDWNEAWKERLAQRSSRGRDPSFWNRRSPSFADNASKTGYAEAFLRIMKPRKSRSVLDMGCGGGTLAIPLAKRVKTVIAADYSEDMLDSLEMQAKQAGISNIRTIHARWEDDWSSSGIGIYDIAIASRSLVVEDLRKAILKLDRAARKQVYISTIVDDGPYDRRIFDALGRKLDVGPDYIYTYNLLYQMGIYAKIDFIVEKNHRTYSDREDALASLRWMFGEMTMEEEEIIHGYLERYLVDDGAGRLIMNYDKTVTWAIIWWDKKGILSAGKAKGSNKR